MIEFIGLIIVGIILLLLLKRNRSKTEKLTEILGNVDNMGYSPWMEGTFRRQQDMLLGMYP